MLSSLPNSFGNLANLQYLDLFGCQNLKRLPDSFKNLVLLEYLNLRKCGELILRSDDFQNITKLEFLDLSRCNQLEELPRHITNQVFLREFYLYGLLREIKIDQLSRLQKMVIGSELLISLPNSLGDSVSLKNLSLSDCYNLKSLPTSFKKLSSLTRLSISGCHRLKSLPNSFGNLFFLAHLYIGYCDSLKSLPASLENLSSLTHLSITKCRKVKCLLFSVGCHNLLEHLVIFNCPISQVDFEAAPSSSTLSNLKQITLNGTEVCKISIPEDHYPLLKSLHLLYNAHLTEIESLPVKLERLQIRYCLKLEKLPSFALLTSLREFKVEECGQIRKIEGIESCTRMEILGLHTRWEVSNIESLKRM
ncbi:disease resistance protein TAO1-like [Cryptomeria japonica]|uniref:disease resistance protein TAO1-like n=1 Tax=Cryptomeria japonica TaxID=3369 RepID=UPI0027D9F840|nr:disease resistance protein TAO1-like [Cryptomeria japonica]XP_059070245.1 disease resistance protein TAO1-like [Cryptomeria japonica]XP_059070246.1 disease resistance protein TAO1-like [Cryptomeria japonica]XP_059070247.1 disease resistance protein TAO1-like [Cryptomeria japonica]